jgi:hypothetical protein
VPPVIYRRQNYLKMVTIILPLPSWYKVWWHHSWHYPFTSYIRSIHCTTVAQSQFINLNLHASSKCQHSHIPLVCYFKKYACQAWLVGGPRGLNSQCWEISLMFYSALRLPSAELAFVLDAIRVRPHHMPVW